MKNSKVKNPKVKLISRIQSKTSKADLGIAWKRPKHGLQSGKWRRVDTKLVGVLYSTRSVTRRKQTTKPTQKTGWKLELARAEKYKPPDSEMPLQDN